MRAVSAAFPAVEFATWQRCKEYLPHTLACDALIKSHCLAFPEAANLLDRTAWYLEDYAQYAQAEPLYQRSLAIREKALGPDHPSTSATLNNLANFYRDHGRYEEAEALYQRSLAIKEKAFPPEHPSTAVTLENYAKRLREMNRPLEAQRLEQRAKAIRAREVSRRNT